MDNYPIIFPISSSITSHDLALNVVNSHDVYSSRELIQGGNKRPNDDDDDDELLGIFMTNNMNVAGGVPISPDDDVNDHQRQSVSAGTGTGTGTATAAEIESSINTGTSDHHHQQQQQQQQQQEVEILVGKKKGEKKIKKPKYAFQTRSQVDILDDGYRWRKYGQKAVKNNRFPRSYYRCTHQGCNVKKQVQRLSRDEGVVVTTYEGMHSHTIDQKSTDNFENILSQMQIYTSF